MALLLGWDPSGLPPKTGSALDDVIAAIQTWAGKVDGINAEERLNALSSGISSLSTVQTGTVHLFSGASAPDGYLLCDGSAVSRETYASLFAVTGTAYGAGNGSTTFNIPNLQQRFPLGKAVSGTGSTLGATGGAIDHTHTGPSHTHTGPSHSHSIANQADHTHSLSGTTATEGAHTHTFTTGTPSTSTFLLANGADQTAASTTHTHSGTTAAGSAHSHAVGTLAAAAAGTHDHGGTTGSSGTGATGASGTGATGTANPPYVVLNYIVKT